jgi:hypothetical protein
MGQKHFKSSRTRAGDPQNRRPSFRFCSSALAVLRKTHPGVKVQLVDLTQGAPSLLRYRRRGAERHKGGGQFVVAYLEAGDFGLNGG